MIVKLSYNIRLEEDGRRAAEVIRSVARTL